MNYLIILMPLMFVFLVVTAIGFIWAVRANQFDDVDGPAHRIIFDQDIVPLNEEKNKTSELNDPDKFDNSDKK